MCHCLVLAGKQADFQWEDEHKVVNLTKELQWWWCRTLRSNICKMDEGGNWRIFNPTGNEMAGPMVSEG